MLKLSSVLLLLVAFSSSVVAAEADAVTLGVSKDVDPAKMSFTISAKRLEDGDILLKMSVAMPPGQTGVLRFGRIPQFFGVYVLGRYDWIPPKVPNWRWMSQDVTAGNTVIITADKPFITEVRLSNLFDNSERALDDRVQITGKFYCGLFNMEVPLDSLPIVVPAVTSKKIVGKKN